MELRTSRTRMLSCRGDLLERARPISAKEAAYAAAIAELGGQQDGLRRQRSTNNAIHPLLGRHASQGTTSSRSPSCGGRALIPRLPHHSRCHHHVLTRSAAARRRQRRRRNAQRVWRRRSAPPRRRAPRPLRPPGRRRWPSPTSASLNLAAAPLATAHRGPHFCGARRLIGPSPRSRSTRPPRTRRAATTGATTAT